MVRRRNKTLPGNPEPQSMGHRFDNAKRFFGHFLVSVAVDTEKWPIFAV